MAVTSTNAKCARFYNWLIVETIYNCKHDEFYHVFMVVTPTIANIISYLIWTVTGVVSKVGLTTITLAEKMMVTSFFCL